MIRGNNDIGEATTPSLSSNVQQQPPEPSHLPSPRLLQPTSIHGPPTQQQQLPQNVGGASATAVQRNVLAASPAYQAQNLNPTQAPPSAGAFATVTVGQLQRPHNVTTSAVLQQYILSGGHVTTSPSAAATQVSASAAQSSGCSAVKPQSPFNVASSSNLARILASTQSYMHARSGTPITAVATGTGSILHTVTATPQTQCHIPTSAALRAATAPIIPAADARTQFQESTPGATVHHMAEAWSLPTTPVAGGAASARTFPLRLLFQPDDQTLEAAPGPRLLQRTPPSPHRTLLPGAAHHETPHVTTHTPVSTYHNCAVAHPQATTNRHKRIKLEEKPPATARVAELRSAILEHRCCEMQTCRETYLERVTELYFHQNNMNFVEYLQWKKRSNPQLAAYLRSNALESDEEELPQQPILNTMLSSPTLAPASTPAPHPAPPPPPSFSEVKVPTVGGTPVAISTSLPLSVSQITQHGNPSGPGKPKGGRHGMVFGNHQPPFAPATVPHPTFPGGTPLVPDVASPPPSSSHNLLAHSPQTSPAVAAPGGTSTGIRMPPHSPASGSITATSLTVASSPTVSRPPIVTSGAESGSAALTHSLKTASVRSPSLPVPSPARLQTRQHSISAVYDSTIGSQEEIVERAKQEAHVMQRISELRKDGLWSEKRLPKVQEPQRNKTHWDYLLEEMVWLATDFAQERKWKKAAGKKCARMCQKYHQERQMREERAEKEAELKLKRIASTIAKEIKTFWASVEKFVEYKQQSRLDLKRKKVLDLHLNFIVDQTEKYSSWLAQGMSHSAQPSLDSSAQISRASSPGRTSESGTDDDFEPTSDHSDDEETIAKEEEELDEQAQKTEVELLEKESLVPLDDLLKGLPPEIFEKPASPLDVKSEEEDGTESGNKREQGPKGVDEEFQVSSAEESADDEATIDEQEVTEKGIDHSQELLDLKDEGEMSLEELMAKYGGAYDSDFEMASESSKEEASSSSDEGESEESEDESEEDLSDNEEGADEMMDIGIESLINPSRTETYVELQGTNPSTESQGPGREITDIAAAAESFKPKGYTYSTAQVATPVPFLLKHSLREYQHIGLDWLVTMYERKLNGILADEMGLGKTIQTIALLAHLACEKGVWGPHLIVVPTSVMLNWEMEFKKWCPAFKILTYYGSQKERKLKRQGWTKPNLFHICITSYKLVIQDHQSFRRKKWKYFILDEAQNIKNFKSQRWQLLLNFTSQRRLLLTGTPLQNSLMELWSLMHFLMPNVFQSHRDFKDWFANPVSGMIEGSHEYNKELISRLHKVLRPFLLRRLKSEVEKQLPGKYEHVVLCRLSKRQRYLYEDFMSQAKTKETLASGNFMSVINVLMQLRKVCNHPNLFEARPITSPFQMQGISYYTASAVRTALQYDPFKHVNFSCLNLLLADLELTLTAFAAHRIKRFQTPRKLIEEIDRIPDPPPKCPAGKIKLHVRTTSSTAAQKASMAASMGSPMPVVVKPLTTPAPTPVATTQVKTVLSSPQLTARTSSPLPSSASQASPAVATALAAATSQPASHPLSGYTLQLVQQQPQGQVSIAQLGTSSVLSSTPITVQIQQTQQGPRLTVPTGQLAQIPAGFAQLVQTSTGQHILLTSTSQNVLQPVHSLNVGQANTSASRMTVSLSSGGSLATSASPTVTLPRVQATVSLPVSTAALSLANTTPVNKPVVRVAPMVVSTAASSLTTTSAVQTPTTTPKVVPTAVTAPAMVAQDSAKPLTRANTKTDEAALKGKEKPKNYSQSLFYLESLQERRRCRRSSCLERIARFNTRRCEACPIYGSDLIKAVSIMDDTASVGPSWHGSGYVQCLNSVKLSSHPRHYWNQTEALFDLVCTPESLLRKLHDILSRYVFVIPPVMTPGVKMHISHPPPSLVTHEALRESVMRLQLNPRAFCLHPIISAMSTQFPDPRLIQYDCGKLQTLDKLLRQLKTQGRRVLLFTQMTRMLDVLEQFLNYHGHIYLRLDGATKIEQRQALMERFNADRRIFCFILSTRSGGIGVNLTGADTVIFYDSDWNPTMDAQAQDRCHRIGQTRDVHIYRLISERTVEENILKKANQKRLLGEVAIEGGNFTTAFFKKHTLQELFEVDFDSSKKATSSAVVTVKVEPKIVEIPAASSAAEVDITTLQLEHALANAEEDTDVQAARKAKKEADLELVEFDESVPYDGDYPRDEDATKMEEELGVMMAELTPVQRYAMNFLESIQEEFSLEQLKQAEEEIEAQKKDWELGRLQVMREEEERRAQLEDNDIPYTYSREDANNQIYISYNTGEQMPTWAPPTPPQDKGDVYIDYSICFLYEPAIMPESQLPPVYVKKEHKRLRLDAGSNVRKQKLRKDDAVCIPRSLFDRPTAAILKMRRDVKLHKNDATLPRPVSTGGSYKPPTVVNKPIMDTHQDNPEWLIHEDWALLQSVQTLLSLNLNLVVVSPAHTPNWDLVSDIVNTTSRMFRSPKQCKNRYESVIIPREEGKILYDTNPKKQKKSKGIYRTKNNRPMRTSQLFQQDKNHSFTTLHHQRFETIKLVSNKRSPTVKPPMMNQASRSPKHAAVLAEGGINYEQPLAPVEVATKRADRIHREKLKPQAAADQQQQQLALQQQQQQQQQLQLQQQQQQQQQLQQQQQQQRQQSQPIAPTHVATALQVAQQQQTTQAVIGLAAGQMTAQQLQSVIGRMTTVVASGLAGSPMSTPGAVRTQRPSATALVMHDLVGAVTPVRSISSPGGQQAVVTMPGLSPSQVQAAIGTPQQRAMAGNTPITSVIAGTIPTQVTTATASGKALTAAQLQILRTQTMYKQQQRLQQAQQQAAVAAQVPKVTMAVTSLLSPTVTAVQVGQAQQRAQAQAVKQAVTRTMTEAEVAQLIKRQKAAAQLAQVQLPTQGQLSSQILAQAQLQQLQQQQQSVAAGQASLATLVKTVSAPSSLVPANPSVTIPVSAVGTMTGVNINVNLPQVKGGVAATKGAIMTHQQLKLQQHILQQRKLQQQQQLQQQKLAQVQAKTQLGTVQMMQQSQPHKAMPTTVTVQQIQQVIKQVQPQALQHLTQVSASVGGTATIMTQAVATSQALTHAVLTTKGGQATMSPTAVTAAFQAAANQQALHTRVIPMTSVPVTQTSSALKQAIQAVAMNPGMAQAHVQAQAVPNVTVDAQGRPLSATASFAGTTSIPLGIKLTAPGTITAAPALQQQRDNLAPNQQQPGAK